MGRELMLPLATLYSRFYGFELRLTPEGRIRARAMRGRSAPVASLDWLLAHFAYAKAALGREGDYDETER